MSRARFDAAVLPYLDDGYTLARYLTRDGEAARDVVQEACLRALRHVDSLRGDDGRNWFLIDRSQPLRGVVPSSRAAARSSVEYDDAIMSATRPTRWTHIARDAGRGADGC